MCIRVCVCIPRGTEDGGGKGEGRLIPSGFHNLSCTEVRKRMRVVRKLTSSSGGGGACLCRLSAARPNFRAKFLSGSLNQGVRPKHRKTPRCVPYSCARLLSLSLAASQHVSSASFLPPRSANCRLRGGHKIPVGLNQQF